MEILQSGANEMGQMPHLRKRATNSRWSADEKAFLADHIPRGALWIHAHMPWRSEKAIRRQAERMGLSMKEPGRLGDLCPQCYENRVVKGSFGARFGICNTCYYREEERKFRQRESERKAKAAKEAARQRAYEAGKPKKGKGKHGRKN